MAYPSTSVIITAHNEGREVLRTIKSVVQNTASLEEIILVDDASTDGSCEGVVDLGVRLIRHERRIGIAYSRDEGSRQAAGDVLCYVDAHQRVRHGSVDRCAEAAIDCDSIVAPTIRGLRLGSRPLYGATFCMCRKKGYFSARWIRRRWWVHSHPVTSLKAPAYSIPRRLYGDLAWGKQLRGWGGSEAMVSLKAFFLKVPIVACHRAVAYHRFRRRSSYEITWDEVWRNHALIARVCFAEATWREYWFPELFAQHVSGDVLNELESEPVRAEHAAFQSIKRRRDHEFWTELLGHEPPRGV